MKSVAERQNKISAPSIPVNCRAFQTCTDKEFAVVSAIQAVYWLTDSTEEAGVDMLCRTMPNVPRRSIERAIKSLKAKGVVGMSRAFGKPSRFTLCFDDLSFREFREIVQSRQVGGDHFRLTGGNDSAKVAEMVRQVGGVNSNYETLRSETLKTETVPPQAPETVPPSKPKVKAASRETYPAEFEQFWDAYPASRRVNKKAALAQWRKEAPPLPVVLTALAWQVKSKSWLEEDCRFVPRPERYDKQRPWEQPQPEGSAREGEDRKREFNKILASFK